MHGFRESESTKLTPLHMTNTQRNHQTVTCSFNDMIVIPHKNDTDYVAIVVKEICLYRKCITNHFIHY